MAVLAGGTLLYDSWDFNRDATQRRMLAAYMPEARCNTANFDVLKRVDTGAMWQDWLYTVRISGSANCARSIQQALLARGAQPDHGRTLLPGYEDSEEERITFDFEPLLDPQIVIWTRDKT